MANEPADPETMQVDSGTAELLLRQLEHPAAAARALPQGIRLGRYELLELIGSGGMGAVYKALHTKLRRVVAVKILSPRRFEASLGVARFRREMHAVGKLDHPNIVRATDAGEAGIFHFIVMDFVEGIDLAQLLKAVGPLPIPDACAAIEQAALGLEHVHQHQLVHRDLKPSNIMLARDGKIKILDLGLARLQEEQPSDMALSQTGQIVGTADFMAPEQGMDSHHVDIRADLYSLGCTLFKLLAGRAPFERPEFDTLLKKVTAHRQVPIPSILEARADLPAALVRVLERLLAKDPADRFATPAEVAEHLRPMTAGANLCRLVNDAMPVHALPAHAPLLSPSPTPREPAVGSTPCEKRADTGQQETTAWRHRSGRPILLVFLLASVLMLGGAYLAHRLGLFSSQSKHEIDQLVDLSAKPSLPWPADYPVVLRERPWGKRIEILGPSEYGPRPEDPARGEVNVGKPQTPDLRYQPLWCRRLAGAGRYYESTGDFTISSGIGAKGCSLFALDNDLARRWFELDIEVGMPQGIDTRELAFGIFFGWQADSEGRGRAYFLRLDEGTLRLPAPGTGKATVSAVELKIPDVDQGGELPRAELQRNVVGVVPLTKPRTMYPVKVRVFAHQVMVAVADEQPCTFQAARDARGALGVWVQRGQALFERAALTALPDKEGP